ncbi:MAG TPA: aminotransferase class III-fold pyridoxal phosphate-dependent enzyme [Steroidobacteraceae bacterium]|nr:aminotransferase class III-fold pyridoxal phosphate-dependent enzyme [Steroidobacteraceae bacterium]
MNTLIDCLIGAAALWLLWFRIIPRVELSLAKHRSLAGHSRWSRRLARILPAYEYDAQRFFDADGAPAEIAARRQAAFAQLADLYRRRFARSAALTDAAMPYLSDLQFTARYRVPFQFSRHVREHLKGGSFVTRTHGNRIIDADGNELFDLTGSYGVNVLGHDFYKECMLRATEAGSAVGPLLGSYLPPTIENARRLCAISGLDQVSFHMSGTEAVMQAVRLARYHNRRRYLVRFCGAYHGWWGDVQPGVGNPVPAPDTLTLEDMSAASLRVLRRRRDISCVLVNPVQSMHPNRAAPGDSALLDGARRAGVDREAYGAWLKQLRAVCSERGIALIFDEVFTGFRLAPGGAQEYFGVRADLVTYGKTVAGGLPIGVLCGRAALMARFRADHPADVCFARGTFNAHPYVMAAMDAFLTRFAGEPVRALYRDLDATWNRRVAALNARLQSQGLPLRVSNLSTIWSIDYLVPSRYNWMLQYYLRAHGLALSWVGTGRLIFNLAYTTDDYEAVVERLQAAATEMQRDGWWWVAPGQSNRSVRKAITAELFQAWCSGLIGSISSPRNR